MGDDLYVTEQIDLTGLEAAEVRAVLHEYSDDAEIERCVACARTILEAAGYDTVQPPSLLIGGLKIEETRPEAGLSVGEVEILGTAGAADDMYMLCARVLAEADQMDRALRDDRILDMRRHAMRFQRAVDCAQHLEAWGRAVHQKRRRDAANRRNIARHNAELHAKAEKDWAPRQEAHQALRAGGMSEAAARREIADRIAKQMGEGEEPPDETTLRKWLSG
jgi:hypothetical protein